MQKFYLVCHCCFWFFTRFSTCNLLALVLQLDADFHPHDVAHVLRSSKQSAAAAKRRASAAAAAASSSDAVASNVWLEQLNAALSLLSTGLLPAALLLNSQVYQVQLTREAYLLWRFRVYFLCPDAF